jgi:hypothetical protein
VETTKFIIDYALEKLKESNTQPKVFGIVLRFQKEAIALWNEKEKNHD